jgi:hypothetical protein
MLEEGRYASISEMAKAEGIERGYVGTLFGPATVLCRSSDHILCSKGDEP